MLPCLLPYVDVVCTVRTDEADNYLGRRHAYDCPTFLEGADEITGLPWSKRIAVWQEIVLRLKKSALAAKLPWMQTWHQHELNGAGVLISMHVNSGLRNDNGCHGTSQDGHKLRGILSQEGWVRFDAFRESIEQQKQR